MRMWGEWFKAAGIRAAKTFAQALIAYLGVAGVTGLLDVDWPTGLSIAALAALLSLLTSVVGLPEVPSSTVSPGQRPNERL